VLRPGLATNRLDSRHTAYDSRLPPTDGRLCGLQNLRHQGVEVLALVDRSGGQTLGLLTAEGDAEGQRNLSAWDRIALIAYGRPLPLRCREGPSESRLRPGKRQPRLHGR
jgi:hypothetical protein